MSITDDFYQTVKQVETATRHFVMGDPTPIKAMWSRADDVAIFGAWGAYEKGWEQVGPRLDWAAARFLEGQVTLEPLTMGMSGDRAIRSTSKKARCV